LTTTLHTVAMWHSRYGATPTSVGGRDAEDLAAIFLGDGMGGVKYA
jgi:hypothetical protein